MTATLRGSYTAYGATPELDRPAFDGKVTGRLDVSRNTALIGEGTLVLATLMRFETCTLDGVTL